jgi:hypothetical protein
MLMLGILLLTYVDIFRYWLNLDKNKKTHTKTNVTMLVTIVTIISMVTVFTKLPVFMEYS